MSKIETAVRAAIVKGTVEAVANPQTAAEQKDVTIIASKVLNEVAPLVAHATNSEPWWKSRVTLGALLAAIAGVLGIFGVSFGVEDQSKVLDLIIALVPVIGAALTLYGRWVAKKPLGS